jgi:hypothetical protein
MYGHTNQEIYLSGLSKRGDLKPSKEVESPSKARSALFSSAR